ncbi:imelysin family protein [Dysgonomonas reticulitermitis]
MRIFFKYLPLVVFVVAMVFGTTSCSDGEDNTGNENQEILEKAVPQYVNNVVITTYKSLADETIDLYEALVALKANKTDANVKKATDEWIATRKYWELSEAFLFGAAGDFGIDPHIDTWPLDRTALVSLLNNNDYLASMDSEDGSAWAGEKLGPSLLGFHGIEYILYANGNVKSASQITNNELIYAVAVAGDLRNQCIRLEAAWAGLDNVSAVKQALIEEFELGVTMGNKSYYGADMINAGKAGSTYRTILDANEAIIEGCVTIADEVATMKIGKPHTGEDPNYLESPYSYNSKVDFIDNIKSIENAYLGGISASARGVSVSDYIKIVHSELNTKVINAIANAIAKIEAIPYPFDTNYSSTQAKAAMDACNELADVLTEAKVALRK